MFNYFPRRIRTVQLPTRHPSPGAPNRSSYHPHPDRHQGAPIQRQEPLPILMRPCLRSGRVFPLPLSRSPLLLQPFPIMQAVRVHYSGLHSHYLITLRHHAGRTCSLSKFCNSTALVTLPNYSCHAFPSRWPCSLLLSCYFLVAVRPVPPPQPFCPSCPPHTPTTRTKNTFTPQ